MRTCKSNFEIRIDSLRTAYARTSHSPHFSHFDFYLWYFCKDKCYSNKPELILDLKEEVQHCVKGVSHDTWRRVVANFIMCALARMAALFNIDCDSVNFIVVNLLFLVINIHKHSFTMVKF